MIRILKKTVNKKSAYIIVIKEVDLIKKLKISQSGTEI